jgi:hypothetical protein
MKGGSEARSKDEISLCKRTLMLIYVLQQIVSSEDADSCRFFLEANNWNLQSAIASYYDAGMPAAVNATTLLAPFLNPCRIGVVHITGNVRSTRCKGRPE